MVMSFCGGMAQHANMWCSNMKVTIQQLRKWSIAKLVAWRSGYKHTLRVWEWLTEVARCVFSWSVVPNMMMIFDLKGWHDDPNWLLFFLTFLAQPESSQGKNRCVQCVSFRAATFWRIFSLQIRYIIYLFFIYFPSLLGLITGTPPKLSMAHVFMAISNKKINFGHPFRFHAKLSSCFFF